MTELTISRADLVEIATEALAASSGVTNEQKLEMCETVHTTSSILIGSWLTKDCGCLVGATYDKQLRPHLPPDFEQGGRWVVGDHLGFSMVELGLDFDQRLKNKLGPRSRGKIQPVRVIDPA